MYRPTYIFGYGESTLGNKSDPVDHLGTGLASLTVYLFKGVKNNRVFSGRFINTEFLVGLAAAMGSNELVWSDFVDGDV